MVVHGEDEDVVQFNYERFRAEGRIDGTNLHLVHNKISELLAFRRTTALARHTGAAVYFVHTSARRGGRDDRRGAGQRPARLRRDAAPVRLLQRRVLQDAARFLLSYLPVAEVPRGPGGALERASCEDGLSCLATDEYPTSLELKLRGRTIEDVTGGNVGAEARMGIAYSEGVVQRGMALTRFADITSTQCGPDLRAVPAQGRHCPRQRRRPRLHRPRHQKDAHPRRLPRHRLQPMGRMGGVGLAGHDHAPGRPDRRARHPAGQPRAPAASSRARSIPPSCSARSAESAAANDAVRHDQDCLPGVPKGPGKVAERRPAESCTLVGRLGRRVHREPDSPSSRAQSCFRVLVVMTIGRSSEGAPSMAVKLFVGGLSFSTSSDRLRQVFARFRHCRVRHGGHRPRHRSLARVRLRRDGHG